MRHDSALFYFETCFGVTRYECQSKVLFGERRETQALRLARVPEFVDDDYDLEPSSGHRDPPQPAEHLFIAQGDGT